MHNSAERREAREPILLKVKGTALTGEANVTESSTDERNLWHSRLGHIGEKGLQILVKKGHLDKSKVRSWESMERYPESTVTAMI